MSGYSKLLPIRLIQQYRISNSVAERLPRAYGGRASEVLDIARELALNKLHNGSSNPQSQDEDDLVLDVLLAPGFPYIEAEVVFAARHEHAVHAEDILARRTRLAFLDKQKSIRVLPRIIELMSHELEWTADQRHKETVRCVQYLRSFGGPIASQTFGYKHVTEGQVLDVFSVLRTQAVDSATKKPKEEQEYLYLDRENIKIASEMLGQVLAEDEMDDCLIYSQHRQLENLKKQRKAETPNKDAKVFQDDSYLRDADIANVVVGVNAVDFTNWWNIQRPALMLRKEETSKPPVDYSAKLDKIQGSGTMFG
jgi:hypothetical protein